MAANDGGPAFPGEQGHTPDGKWNQTWEPGMSLRDWFAGQALKGLLSNPMMTHTTIDWLARFTETRPSTVIRRMAYDYGEDMIAERGERDGTT